MDLLDVGTDRLTWRRLRVLIDHLPPESATAAAMFGDETVWGLTEHLLAGLVDETRVGNWQRANAGAKRHAQTERPTPLPRPGIESTATAPNRLPDDELARRLRERAGR